MNFLTIRDRGGWALFPSQLDVKDGKLRVHLLDQTEDQGGNYPCREGDNRERPLPGMDA